MLLGIYFALIAFFYASVGFGGGSSYIALLVFWGAPYTIIPMIALVCNIVVVSGNSFHYIRAGYLNWRLMLPPTLTYIPMAYLGGRLEIEKTSFFIVLFFTLLVSGVQLLIKHRQYDGNPTSYKPLPIWLGSTIGAILGLLAGLVGIGGGIFLAPILYTVKAGSPKQIATTTSLFILLNSASGFVGQFQKVGVTENLMNYWYLPLFVLVGGQLANFITIKHVPARIIALFTALLILFVTGRLGLHIWSLLNF